MSKFQNHLRNLSISKGYLPEIVCPKYMLDGSWQKSLEGSFDSYTFLHRFFEICPCLKCTDLSCFRGFQMADNLEEIEIDSISFILLSFSHPANHDCYYLSVNGA